MPRQPLSRWVGSAAAPELGDHQRHRAHQLIHVTRNLHNALSQACRQAGRQAEGAGERVGRQASRVS